MVLPQPKLMDKPLPVPSGMTATGGGGCSSSLLPGYKSEWQSVDAHWCNNIWYLILLAVTDCNQQDLCKAQKCHMTEHMNRL